MNKQKGLALSQLKGFTIIELIVVIAVIAVLAGVVLANVGNYINKSKDAAIQEQLRTVATDVISDAISSTGISFSTATPCTSNKAWIAITNIQKGSGLAVCNSNFISASNPGTKFCACVQSIVNTANYYCADSDGKRVTTTTNCTSASYCGSGASGATAYTCP